MTPILLTVNDRLLVGIIKHCEAQTGFGEMKYTVFWAKKRVFVVYLKANK